MNAHLFNLAAWAAAALAMSALAYLAWTAGADGAWPLLLLVAGIAALLAASRPARRGGARAGDEAATVTQLERSVAALEELVRRDPATGLYNRRALFERLEEETGRARRHDTHLAIVVLDIDRFKAINDRHGHAAGDAVIFAIAAHLADHTRGSDLVARYGGEEFVLVLPHTGRTGAATIADRILRAIATSPIPVNGDEFVELTISAGVAAFPENGEDGEALLAAADRALYAAKHAGRNRVALAEPVTEAIAPR